MNKILFKERGLAAQQTRNTVGWQHRLAGVLDRRKLGTVFCAALLTLSQGAQAQEDTTTDLTAEFERELRLVSGLKEYNQQLELQLEGQRQAVLEIEKSIGSAEALGPQVAPLMSRMIEALAQFIEADLPFRLQERKDSVDRLEVALTDPSFSDSERFRQILDIYTVETEYGQTYEAYPDELNEQPVDILRIGRLALYAQTRDQNQSYSYDRATGQWTELDEAYNRNIRKAIKVAAKTVAPELLSLPISAPEGN